MGLQNIIKNVWSSYKLKADINEYTAPIIPLYFKPDFQEIKGISYTTVLYFLIKTGTLNWIIVFLEMIGCRGNIYIYMYTIYVGF